MYQLRGHNANTDESLFCSGVSLVIIAWPAFIGSFKPTSLTADCGAIGDLNYDTCTPILAGKWLPITAATSYYYDTVMRVQPRNVEKGTMHNHRWPRLFAGALPHLLASMY
jgi:hypothetical protein